jgi:hypothetical protein
MALFKPRMSRLANCCIHQIHESQPRRTAFEADRFDGFGPNIYLMAVAEWKVIVGEESGEGLANLIDAFMFKRGKIPKYHVLVR